MHYCFADRLTTAVRTRGNPVVVGLDPRWQQLPAGLRSPSDRPAPEQMAAAYASFSKQVIDVVAALLPAVKPQSAFFEQLGPPGVQALAEVIQYARAAGLLVIVDAKRNDIGSTAEAYAEAYLGASDERPLGGDALTVSPYLGDDSLAPFLSAAQDRGAGIFVLVKTSNPGGAKFQDLICDGRPLYAHVAEYVAQLARATQSECGYGVAGAVVGATWRGQLEELRQAMPHAWLLVPGYGSQGGTAEDVAVAFDEQGLGAIVNNSRGIIFAHAQRQYAKRFGENRWQDAVAAATEQMIAELRDKTSAGRLVASK